MITRLNLHIAQIVRRYNGYKYITSQCAICDLRHLTTSSTHWCRECEEALCIDCKEHHSLSKASRSHHIIPISEYNKLPPFVTTISLLCSYHNEKYVQYCVKHECPICFKCINEHGNCGGLTLFEQFVRDIKSSEAFRDMEQSLKDMLVNIDRIREDRKSNIEMIKNKKKQIIEEISRLKKQINKRLDKLQEDIMVDLEREEMECCKKIQSIFSTLNDQAKDILQFNPEIENMKEYASDMQGFLGMGEIQKQISQSENCIQSMIANKETETVILEFTIDASLHFLSNAKTFGSIVVKHIPSDGIELVRSKDKQAQILVTGKNESVYNMKLNLKRQLRTLCNTTRGCCVTVNGGFIFTDYQNHSEKLVVLNADGENKYTIPFSELYSSYDLACVDDKTVAITTGNSHGKTGVIITDLTTRKEKRIINLSSTPYGITFDGKSLICCCKDIRVISCTDFSNTIIPNTAVSAYSSIATHDGKIFYSDLQKNTVTCCSYSGVPLWELKNKSVLQRPRGITVDDKGNVFVLIMDSSIILVISPDGKQYRQIQTKQYDLTKPSSIFFDKIRKQLLVTNEDCFAHLYSISYF
ncbi:unnamed protein product [Mytilus coruscus]|uniref:B box-type domain-containing protein n=1 Tax=Mytilus coruscus TaxID=42192 RepID=A0A6J8CTC2_MYTCO|nr:unnamed protein product [Mytilus coruscus]